jgi:hypothetical protein
VAFTAKVCLWFFVEGLQLLRSYTGYSEIRSLTACLFTNFCAPRGTDFRVQWVLKGNKIDTTSFVLNDGYGFNL